MHALITPEFAHLKAATAIDNLNDNGEDFFLIVLTHEDSMYIYTDTVACRYRYFCVIYGWNEKHVLLMISK